MYPDTTGGAFGRGVPPQPIPPLVGAAWIPAQRSPWEPPPRQQSEPPPAVPVPVAPVGASADRPVTAGPPRSEITETAESATVEDAAPVVEDAAPGVEDDGSGGEDAESRGADTVPAAAEDTAPAAEAARDDPSAEPEPVAVPGPAAEPEPAAVPAPRAEAARPLRPGDLPQTRITLWGGASAEAETFRERIREAGNLFVDDPNFAVTATAAVVTEAVTALAAALARQHAELDPRHSSDNPDTEALRVAVLRYRELLDRVLAL